METLLHIATDEDWEDAQKTGEYKPLSLSTEGFIHCSRRDQVEEVANRIFKGREDILLLTIDPQKVPSDIRVEEAENGKHYPHIYGCLPVAAVVEKNRWSPQADGSFSL